MPSSISDAPESKTGMKWLRRDVDKLDEDKMDKDVFETAMKAVNEKLRERKKSSSEIKKLAEAARDKKHECTQGDTIVEIKNNIKKIWSILDSWRNVKIIGGVSVFAILAAAIFNYATLSTSVKSNTNAVTEMKVENQTANEEIAKEVNSIKIQIVESKAEQKIDQDRRDKKRDLKLEKLLQKGFGEIKADIKPNRRRTQ